VTASTNGETVENLDITGNLTIDADNVTVENVCIADDGHDTGFGIMVQSGSSNPLIEHVTIQSSSSSSPSAFMDTGIWDVASCPGNGGLVVDDTVVEGAAESVHVPTSCSLSTGSGALIENSYLQAGYYFSGAHNEAVYLSDTSVTLNHDTLLNADSQTAVLFGDNNGGSCCVAPDNDWVVKDSLLGGGGYLAYWDAKCASSPTCSSAGSGSLDITDNRWARCTTTPFKFDGYGTKCASASPGDPSFGQSGGADSSGYYPNGGYYGGDVYGYCAGATWSANVWDDNGAAVSCG